MSDTPKDPNSAPGQADDPRPTAVDAHLAQGAPGDEPPFEKRPAKIGRRERSAAGFTSIWETVHRGTRDMGVKRSLRTLTTINQKDGFDCPSCAWPDPDGERKAAEFCENGAKAVASEAMKARATPEFFAQHPIADLLAQSDFWMDQQGRLTHPMLRRPGATHYEPIEWQAAFDLIAGELKALESADEASFYTSGRASNEAAFMYGLFARMLGTNNLPDCSNMCHESSGAGLTETIGIGKATVKIEDFSYADSIFVIGQNPGTCHPRMLTELQKAARNGCRIVSVNPLAETGMLRFKNPQEPLALFGRGTPIASLFLPVRVNGDVALLKGIMKEMLEADRRGGGQVLAHDFIAQHTEGFDALRRRSRSRELGPDRRRQRRFARADPPGRRDRRGFRADDLLLGDGDHAAQQRRRQRAEHRQLRALARSDRPPRRGPVSRTRPQQRPGRSHGGHLGEDERPIHGGAGQGVRLLAAEKTRLRHRAHHPGHARGEGEGLRRPGRQLPERGAGHPLHRRSDRSAAA